MRLETERLLLRDWEPEDAVELYRHASDPQVGPAAGWPAHKSVAESRSIILDVLAVPNTYAIVLKKTGLPVGSVGLKTGPGTDLTDRTDECELGYWIGSTYWGQGLVPEAAQALLRHAFEDLGMQAVWCAYYDGNTKSRRVQEKLGFSFHHTSECVEVPLLGETRTGHVNLLTRRDWERCLAPPPPTNTLPWTSFPSVSGPARMPSSSER